MNWYHQLMSEISREMGAMAGFGRTFVLPVTAASQYRAVDVSHMSHTPAWRSVAAQLDLPLLTAEQKEAAVMGLARKIAAANGRTAPATIPAAFTKLLDFAGSSPGDLTYVMEGLGNYFWREDDRWRKGMQLSFPRCWLLILHEGLQQCWPDLLSEHYITRMLSVLW